MSRSIGEIWCEVDNAIHTSSVETYKAKIDAATKIKCAEIIAEAIQGIYTGDEEDEEGPAGSED